jgi:phage terminase small subunit
MTDGSQPLKEGKRETFAQAVVRLSDAAKAYREAYNVRPNTKPETIWSASSRLMANDKVAARVNWLRAGCGRCPVGA